MRGCYVQPQTIYPFRHVSGVMIGSDFSMPHVLGFKPHKIVDYFLRYLCIVAYCLADHRLLLNGPIWKSQDGIMLRFQWPKRCGSGFKSRENGGTRA